MKVSEAPKPCVLQCLPYCPARRLNFAHRQLSPAQSSNQILWPGQTASRPSSALGEGSFELVFVPTACNNCLRVLLERAGAILRQFASNMSDTNPRYDFVGPDWSTGLHTQEASAIFTQSHWRGVLQQLANRQSRLGTLVIAGLSSSHSESAWSPQLGAATLAAGSAVIRERRAEKPQSCADGRPTRRNRLNASARALCYAGRSKHPTAPPWDECDTITR